MKMFCCWEAFIIFVNKREKKPEITNMAFSMLYSDFLFFSLSDALFLAVSNWTPTSIDAESLCNRLTEKLNLPHGHRLVLAHMPLLLVCLEVCKLDWRKGCRSRYFFLWWQEIMGYFVCYVALLSVGFGLYIIRYSLRCNIIVFFIKCLAGAKMHVEICL